MHCNGADSPALPGGADSLLSELKLQFRLSCRAAQRSSCILLTIYDEIVVGGIRRGRPTATLSRR